MINNPPKSEATMSHVGSVMVKYAEIRVVERKRARTVIAMRRKRKEK